MNINTVMFSGRITKTPEIKEFVNEKKIKVVKFILAQNRGEESTIFINFVAYDKIAEIIAMVDKGTEIIIEGRLNQNRWINKNTGESRHNIEIIVHRVHFLPREKVANENNGSN